MYFLTVIVSGFQWVSVSVSDRQVSVNNMYKTGILEHELLLQKTKFGLHIKREMLLGLKFWYRFTR